MVNRLGSCPKNTSSSLVSHTFLNFKMNNQINKFKVMYKKINIFLLKLCYHFFGGGSSESLS
jgi:hypothetical protein